MAARIAGASFFREWSPDTTTRVIPLGRVLGWHGHGRELWKSGPLRAARRV